jgi:hypothetical protein
VSNRSGLHIINNLPPPEMEPTPTSPAAWRERLAPRDSDGQSDVESPGWLEVDGRPLDWNGPAGRPFSRLREIAAFGARIQALGVAEAHVYADGPGWRRARWAWPWRG